MQIMRAQLQRLDAVIERRLLVNYRVDPEALRDVLPAPFRPQVVSGYGVAGVCLIRLGQVRAQGLPAAVGFGSENAAHRIAVEWEERGETRHGVYIPRRDTSSALTALFGGSVFPGYHHRASFDVHERGREIRVGMHSTDATVSVDVHVELTEELSGSELFGDTDEASAFFASGSCGYSPAGRDRLEGVRLTTEAWEVRPARVISAHSSVMEDVSLFPPGSAALDCALVMRGVPVVWERAGGLRTGLSEKLIS